MIDPKSGSNDEINISIYQGTDEAEGTEQLINYGYQQLFFLVVIFLRYYQKVLMLI